MEKSEDIEVKVYLTGRPNFKIKNPAGGFIEFVGGSYMTADPRVIEHLDRIVKEEPHRQIRIKGENDPIPPGHDLDLRQRQLAEWHRQQATRNPENSEYSSPAQTKVASSQDMKPKEGAAPGFTAAQAKSAADLLRDRIAQSAVKQAETK